jgi:hypothetical protein
MVPSSGVSNPAIIRKTDVFPAPLGPRSEKNSPRFTVSDTWSTANVAPCRFTKDVMSMLVDCSTILIHLDIDGPNGSGAESIGPRDQHESNVAGIMRTGLLNILRGWTRW